MTRAQVMSKITEDDRGCWRPALKETNRGYSRGHDFDHRDVYRLFVGPIPKDLRGKEMQLDHTCRNKWCWQPRHLRPMTNAENTWLAHIAKNNRQMSRKHLRISRAMHDMVGGNDARW